MQATSATDWQQLRRRYEAAALISATPYARNLWAITADDVQRLMPSGVSETTLGEFAQRLRAEAVDAASIEIYQANVRAALAWCESHPNA